MEVKDLEKAVLACERLIAEREVTIMQLTREIKVAERRGAISMFDFLTLHWYKKVFEVDVKDPEFDKAKALLLEEWEKQNTPGNQAPDISK